MKNIFGFVYNSSYICSAIGIDGNHKSNKMTNAQIIEIAKIKSQRLTTNTQIRLTADVNSLWLYNFAGRIYIGSDVNEPTQLPFKSKPVFTMSNKLGEKVADLQLLF